MIVENSQLPSHEILYIANSKTYLKAMSGGIKPK